MSWENKSVYILQTYSKEAFLADLRNVDWNIIDEIPDLINALNLWNKECHAPTKRTRIKGYHVPWMTSELKTSMQMTRLLFT